MWCEVDREVKKCPHKTMASLKVMTSDVMTDLDREVIIHACKKFKSWIDDLGHWGYHQKNVYILCI
jgi:hypothetical protein